MTPIGSHSVTDTLFVSNLTANSNVVWDLGVHAGALDDGSAGGNGMHSFDGESGILHNPLPPEAVGGAEREDIFYTGDKHQH